MDTSASTPLSVYVLGALGVWAVIMGVVWMWDNIHVTNFIFLCGGFWIGMFVMYVAAHLCVWE
jgi:hypothetical protein